MPVAGLGSRFATAGITKPKPLIEIGGKPMVKWAADSIPFVDDEDYIFIVREAHVDRYDLDERLRELFSPAVDIIVIDYLTEGPACTAELAAEYMAADEPILITDSDHYFENEGYEDLISDLPNEIVGAIPVFKSEDEGLSYSAVDNDMQITRVAEKERISGYANIGAYYFATFDDFRWALDNVRDRQATVNDEFYVAPLYNELINRGDTVVARECDENWILGTPESVETFKENFLSSGPEQ